MVTKGICLAKLSFCGYGIIMRRTYIPFSFLLMACLFLGGCGLLFGDAAGELRDDGGTKMPAAQGERIPYKLSIEVDGERRVTADEKRAVGTAPDGEPGGVPLGGSPDEGGEAGPAAPQADVPDREGTGATPPASKGNSGLSDKMRALSQLEQLRSDPPDSLLGLERRARGDVETAVKLLHSQGYYEGTATFQMDDTAKPVRVRLQLTPGPRYVLGRASVRYEPAPVVPAALKHGKRRAPYSGLGALWGDEAREATPPPRFPDTLRGVTAGEPVTADQMLEAVEKLPERLRRRGYPPEAVRDFCERIGVAKSTNVVEYGFLEHCLREDLNETAQRVMAVLRPVKLTITNYPEGQRETVTVENNPVDPEAGVREVPFSRTLYIEADDFLEEPIPKYKRLTPGGQECRLKGAYLIRCTGCMKNAAGEVIEVLCEYDPASKGGNPADGRKVKGATIHWVEAETAADAEVRLYDALFTDPAPDGPEKNFLDFLNPESLQILTHCKVEQGLAQAPMPEAGKTAKAYQFMRQGYFCLDSQDASPTHLVFNRSVSLKDSFKKK